MHTSTHASMPAAPSLPLEPPLLSVVPQVGVVVCVAALHALLLCALRRTLPHVTAQLVFPKFEVPLLLLIYESTCQTAVIALATRETATGVRVLAALWLAALHAFLGAAFWRVAK